MKRIALALTWDGARFPIRSLPPKARAFLGKTDTASALEMAALFQADQVEEIRICWVPRLQGGEEVLAAPFSTKIRVAFMPAKMVPLGDVLGIIYKR